MKSPRIWIITADGARARFFLKEGRELTEEEHREEFHPRTSAMGRDEPGRAFDSTPSGRHGTEPHKDLHQADEDDFCRGVAETISERHGQYDRIILIAAPRALGVLRQFLKHLETEIEEVPKDLTHLDAKPLSEALADVL